MNKSELLNFFSSNPEKYYKVNLFDKYGFQRYSCTICGKYFWTLTERLICPDHEDYSFLGNPPTSKRYGYTETWSEIRKYFESQGHAIINRYPVVCRWREDLYYTIASIVDFQRVIENKVIFELPSNPLVVPQMCLRFNDIENVGISGRHYSSFCMIGQTCNADVEGGYWKDRCIELDFNLLVDILGIPPKEITFVEDVWIGAGAFGSSLEYFVRGLELGNAVFTEFEGNEKDYRVMKNKIIDMGAGLERFSWITKGTPTSYDCTFEPVLGKIYNITGLENFSSLKTKTEESDILSKYFSKISTKLDTTFDLTMIKKQIAKELNLDFEKLERIIVPYESLFTIVDHMRTLIFAISDGSLPSNVGGGYNLRVILRRTLSLLRKLGIRLTISDVVDMHLEQLNDMYPELKEFREDIHTILDIESKRFLETKNRIESISNKIKKEQNKLEVDDLIRLYESDGVTPDYLVEEGLISSVPSNFYTKLSELHSSSGLIKKEKNDLNLKEKIDFDSLKKTDLLFYQDPIKFSFDAKIIKILENNYIVLDKTYFYPRGGGQEPDFGYIGSSKVSDVIKIKDVVLHRLAEPISTLIEGEKVTCLVEKERRIAITKNHTSTHIINQASKNILGSWVWQNSAFKEEDYARLDITHHSSLSREEIYEIEKRANEIVRNNLPVLIKNYNRGDAEQNFGFRIYQGGVVPSNNVRIVNIGNIDIEACAGTHVFKTGDIGLIRILKTERIQDGVVRIEFVSGQNAIKYTQGQDYHLHTISNLLGTSREKTVESLEKTIKEFNNTKKKVKNIVKNISSVYTEHVLKNSILIESNLNQNSHIKYSFNIEQELDEEFHLVVGQNSTDIDGELIYVAVLNLNNSSAKVIVYCGKVSGDKINAGLISNYVSKLLGGSGGGSRYFGQGGGKDLKNLNQINENVLKLIKEKLY